MGDTTMSWRKVPDEVADCWVLGSYEIIRDPGGEFPGDTRSYCLCLGSIGLGWFNTLNEAKQFVADAAKS